MDCLTTFDDDRWRNQFRIFSSYLEQVGVHIAVTCLLSRLHWIRVRAGADPGFHEGAGGGGGGLGGRVLEAIRVLGVGGGGRSKRQVRRISKTDKQKKLLPCRYVMVCLHAWDSLPSHGKRGLPPHPTPWIRPAGTCDYM